MLFIAIPAHNEVETIGVLLWRLRTVLARFPREYHVVVFDDASTDSTLEVLTQYEKVLPLTILGVARQVGYARAMDALLRHIVSRTRHPRRDAILVLQGDFTDPPELIPEFARRFEGGADLVVGERIAIADAPRAVHKLFRYTNWSTRAFVHVDGARDVTSTFRLVRTVVVRDLLRERGDAPLLEGNTWTANGDLLLRMVPHARRLETVPVQSTYGVRIRDTRRDAIRDGVASLKWAWSVRKSRPSFVTRDEYESRERPDRDAAELPLDGERTSSRARRDRSRRKRSPREARARRERTENATSTTSELVSNGPVPDVTVISDRTREHRRRHKRRIDASDVVGETLSLVDPAAGIFGVEEESEVDDTAREERRRKRKRRRSRSRTRTESAEGEQAADIAAQPDETSVEGDSDDVVDAEQGEMTAEESATRRRRRGRRGKRGGRRARRGPNANETDNASERDGGDDSSAANNAPEPRDE